MKICGKCKEHKEAKDFHKDKHKADGLRSVCKSCSKAYTDSISCSPKVKYSNYKAGAKRRNYTFDLTFTQFMSYWQQPCEYCGDDIDTIGLDRVDNEKGYEVGNVIACCFTCNKAKGALGQASFLMWIEKVYRHSITGD